MSESDPEAEIASLRAALAAERARGEAFAELSHELRTLVSGIAGMTSLLLDTELSSEQRDYGKRIRGHCDALTGLLNDVLDLRRIEAGKLKLESADVDVRRVVEEASELFAERAVDKGIELVVAVAEGVPAIVRGDPGRLRQVIVNLVSNAIKFTDEGEVVVRAAPERISAAEVVVRFEVRDSGRGIGPAGQARLFQPFSQVHEGGGYGGSGLGLALARQLVEAMGGTIGVESAEGAGSRFHFTARFEQRPALGDRGAIPRVDVAGRRVLCAAPSASVRASLGDMAAALGVELQAAENGQGALEVLRAAVSAGGRHDVALLDVALPGVFDLYRALDTDPAFAGLPVVLLGYPGQRLPEDDRSVTRPAVGTRLTPRAASVRPVTHLAKPVRRAQLFACLRKMMGGAVETVVEGAAPESHRGVPTSRRTPALTTDPAAVTTRTRPLPAAPPSSSEAASSEDRPLILLVEDNAVNQRVGKLMVEKRGYRVDVASDGLEAIAATAATAYAAVLMDCQMPRLDGYAATREIRERDAGKPPLPIIAMTANAGPGARERCLAAGMDDYVAKPVTAEAIDEVLRRWVRAPASGPVASPAPSPPVRRPSSPVIDLGMLHKLRGTQRAGEPDIVAEVVQIFLQDAPSRLAAIREAVARGDLATAARTAHTLKGSASHLGAKTLTMLCARFEDKVRSGAEFNASFAVEAIEEELDRVKRALAREVRAESG